MRVPPTTPNLVRELEVIAAEAKRAKKAIAAGTATTGASSLSKIETRALDAVRYHREDRERERACSA